MKPAIITISFLAFSMALFHYAKKKRSRIELFFYLSWFLLFGSLIVASDYKSVFVEEVINVFSLLFFVWLTLLPPLLYNIVYDRLKIGVYDNKNYYLPAALFLINIFCLIYFGIEKDDDNFTYEVVENVMSYSNYVIILFIFPISTIYYSYKAYKLLKYIPSKKLYIEDKNKFFLFCFVLLYDVYILIWIIQNYFMSDSYLKTTLKFYYILYFIVSYYCVWKVAHSQVMVDDNEGEDFDKVLNDINEKLIQKIKMESVFLNSKLTVKTLAKDIGTNEKYLSHLINKRYDKNFSNFINDYRIEYSKKLLTDKNHQNYTIEAIGGLSGFNSKSGFNSTFKKYTGYTPSQYKNKESL
ncbi:helix-turn-helix domain-containing protein [Pontimicrobium sp. MEBiC06410]|jgi:AraC-like DNA-binding protein